MGAILAVYITSVQSHSAPFEASRYSLRMVSCTAHYNNVKVIRAWMTVNWASWFKKLTLNMKLCKGLLALTAACFLSRNCESRRTPRLCTTSTKDGKAQIQKGPKPRVTQSCKLKPVVPQPDSYRPWERVENTVEVIWSKPWLVLDSLEHLWNAQPQFVAFPIGLSSTSGFQAISLDSKSALMEADMQPDS